MLMYNTDIKQISLKKIKIKLRFAFFLAHGSKSYYSTSNTLEYYTENPLPVLRHVTEEHGTADHVSEHVEPGGG